MLADDIDCFYEAAVLPEKWPHALDRLALLSGGVCGSLFVATPRPTGGDPELQFVANEAGAQLIHEFTALDTPIANSRMVAGFRLGRSRWMTDLDIFSREMIDKDPFYTEFLRPRGFGWVAANMVDIPHERALCFSVEKRFSDGPMTELELTALESVRPHLGRAALLAAESAFRMRRMVTLTLAAVGVPGAILSPRGRILDANDLFATAAEWIGSDGPGRFRLAGRKADLLFEEALQRLTGGHELSIASFAVRGEDPQQRAVVHLLPIRREARDVFTGAAALIVVNVAGSIELPPVDILQMLLDLTPAEAQIARNIAKGASVREVSGGSGRSYETVRTQLKSILAKSGLRDQRDLVALVRSFGMPPGF